MKLDKCTDLVLDSDVIIAFIKGGKINDIDKIFPNQLIVTDIVIEELRNKLWKNIPYLEYIQELLEIDRIKIKQSTIDPYLREEYLRLKKIHGKGESMSMSYCKRYDTCLCSSNFSDVFKYCKDNNIILIPILDFVYYAYKHGIWTLPEADYFLYEIAKLGDYIPHLTSITDYKPKPELILDFS